MVNINLFKIMKTITNEKKLNINKILESYRIPDHAFFVNYLSEIFIDLSEKSQNSKINRKIYF